MSSSSKSIPQLIFFFFFFCLVFLQAANATYPLYHICFNKQNFTSGDSFDYNIRTLLDYLYVHAPYPSGFKAVIVGQNYYKVYGLALCRGDLYERECDACLRDARKEIINSCPYNKGAIIWYEKCLLKYSDSNFFGQIDRENRICTYKETVEYPERLNPKVHELLNGLASKVSGTPKLYATGVVELGGKLGKVYGMVQCTRDLSRDDCKRCVDWAVSKFPYCSPGARGGSVVGGSCTFRYELYPFLYA